MTLRSRMRSFVGLLSLAIAACDRPNAGAGRAGADSAASATGDSGATLVVVTYGGGDYQRSHIVSFLEPFTRRTGIVARSVVWGAEYGRFFDMVRSGRVPWDVVEVTAAHYARGVSDSLFVPLPVVIDSTVYRPLPQSPGVGAFGVPNVYWSTVLAYRRDQFTGTQPASWADFYDTRGFPGPRALYDSPRGNLEFALLAAGVRPDRLYPLDVDRAFAKLDSIKPHVRVWWTDATESVRLLLTRQVVMSTVWSGRIYASPTARRELQYTWAGAAHELDYWVIPRGSRRVAEAASFILFASRPGPMAQQAELTAYGPANSLAVDSVAAAVRLSLPTYGPNWQVSFVIDSRWWAANERAVAERWLRWRNR